MKKISERTLEQLRAISPDELLAHGVIQAAPNHKGNRGFVCPMCGSGTGQNHNGRGDGAGTFDNQNRFYCHSCQNADNHGHKISTIDLFAISRNLQNENFNEICRQMCNEFNIAADFDEMDDLPRRSRRRTFKAKIEPPVDTAERDLIRRDLSADDQPLIDFVNIGCSGAWRGLPLDILLAHNCKYNPQWTSPTSRLEKKFSTPTPRLLVPAGENSYLARLTVPLERFDDTAQKFIHEKQHAGRKQLFNADVLNANVPIFCVEGYIDALSIELAEFPAVALGGRSSGNLLVDAVANLPRKPRIIILLDSDEQGRSAAPKLYDELINVDCRCCVRFISDEVSKIDANQILVESGVDELRERLQEIYDGSLAELDAVATELASRHEERLNDDDLNFLFQGDLSDLDFARRFERVFGDRVRWLTDSECWLIYGGGVWTRGTDSNSCVLPLTRSVADLMSQYAENKDERKIADVLKSTRKISSSITLLKAIDSIRITADDLNRHSELLNCLNGVIDLTTGKLFPHAPSLLITQKCAAAYNPQCSDTTFADFLKTVMPDEETRSVIVRFLGYCLSGEVSEEKFLFVYGRGGNGKGTMLLTLRTLLKDYAREMPVDSIIEGGRFSNANGRATTELNPLENCRLAVVDELPRGARMDVAKVNRLTGGDLIPIRRLHAEFTEIVPTHKFIMCGNFRPQLDDSRDAALLRRLLAVEFLMDFTKNPDVHLKKRLLSDKSLSGALNLLVPAAREFYREGLLEPSKLMNDARKAYLDENDFIGEFLAEHYTFDEKSFVKRKDLLRHVKAICQESLRYRDADLTALIAKIDGVTLIKGDGNTQIFKGLAKKDAPTQQNFDFNGEPVDERDAPFE